MRKTIAMAAILFAFLMSTFNNVWLAYRQDKSNAVAKASQEASKECQELANRAVELLKRETKHREGPCAHLWLPDWNIINATEFETTNVVFLMRCQPSGETSFWKAERLETKQ